MEMLKSLKYPIAVAKVFGPSLMPMASVPGCTKNTFEIIVILIQQFLIFVKFPDFARGGPERVRSELLRGSNVPPEGV